MDYTTNYSQAELRNIISMMLALDEAGVLAEALEEFWHYFRQEAQDREHCTYGELMHIDQMGDQAAKILDAPLTDCKAAAEQAILRTRYKIAEEVFANYLGHSTANGKKRSFMSELMEQYEKYGLDAMVALPPQRPAASWSATPSSATPSIRIVRDEPRKDVG